VDATAEKRSGRKDDRPRTNLSAIERPHSCYVLSFEQQGRRGTLEELDASVSLE